MASFERENNEFDDNDRPNVRRVMTGGVPQFMVFLNGMILTVVAYMVLSIFMRDVMIDEYHRMIVQSRDNISGHMDDMQSDLQMLATILTLSETDNTDLLRKQVQKILPDNNRLDHLVWIYPSNGSWKYRDIMDELNVGDGRPRLTPDRAQPLVRTIISQRNKVPGVPFIVTDFSAADYTLENEAPIVKSRTIVTAINVQKDNIDSGILASVSRMYKVADMRAILDRPTIKRLTINDMATGQRLFLMDRSNVNIEEKGSAGDFSYSDEIDVAGNTWKVSLALGTDRNMLLLSQSPLLLLLFGLTLTIVGTLYVRNNQRQSFRLSTMNRALAQKNYELNAEAAERERLNQVLRKAEREYRAIIDSVSDIIFELNADGDILFLNETWPKITGFEIEQSVNRNIFELLHPQDQEEQKFAFENMIMGKRPAYRSFIRLRTSNGSYHAAELAMSMLRQDEAKQLRVVGTITDVEERRRTERALTEAEKKYRTIVENAAGGIYQVTPDGHFLSVNPAYARILDFDAPESLLKVVRNAHEQLYKNPRERAQFVRELERNNAVQGYETQMITRTGDEIWVNENARAVRDDDGNILYYEGSLENITQRKEAEIKMSDAIVQSNLANRAKSEFLANMSHELRTPLNAIIGFSEIIRNEVFGAINHRQYWEYAKDIHESGKHLLRIINDILDVSRIEAGERQLNETLVDMGRLIKTCVDFVAPKVEENKLSITNMIDGNIPDIVGEELAIKQVLLNILSNAIKFTPDGGMITLSQETDSAGRLRISITDTGVGLDDNEIIKALSPFGQVETSLSRSTSGAGLGLTLVKSLMELHGGGLELVSQKGIGTTATIVFPKKRVALKIASTRKNDDETSAPQEKEGDESTNHTLQ